MSPLTAPDLACRLTRILAALCAAIAVRAARDRAIQPLLSQLWAALRRRAGRFDSLAARLHAGRLSPRRATPPAPRKPPPHRSANAAPPRPPRGFAWLVRLAPETAAYGSQLQALLGEPEAASLLEASPQARRLLRPLCRMLGVRPGPTLAPALVLPPRQRKPPPARPKPARPPDLRPRPARPWRLGSFVLPPRPAPPRAPPPHNATAPPALPAPRICAIPRAPPGWSRG